MNISTAITLAIAVIGAVLGVINTWQAITRDRIRLRVTPKIYLGGEGDMVFTGSVFPSRDSSVGILNPELESREHDFCFEIVNVGFVPVVVAEVGFLMRRTTERASITDRKLLDGGAWPRRLEAREAVTVLIPPHPDSRLMYANFKCAYVTTACGLTFKGTSKVFRDIVRRARQKKPNTNLDLSSNSANAV